MGRALLIRDGLVQAVEDDRDAKKLTASSSYEENLRALEEWGKLRKAGPAQEIRGALRGHGHARRHLRRREASEEAFSFTEGQR